ncbi:MAG TPA: extracellular solute-binding protein, partial [Chloroflexota bacterium]|nr:extracellular solute-binding protein [Chloroflexota bacterium]
VPWILGGSNLFWNKDLFTKAGLDPDKPPDTMDDFVNYAKKITNGDVYGFATPSKDTHENGQWPRRFGGDWFNKDLTQCVADSKEALAGFQFLDDLFHKHKVAMPAAIVDQQPGLLGYFEAGKIGMITAQNTSANTIRKAKPDIKIGAARMAKGPADDPMGRACYGGAGLLAVAKTTKAPEQSWKLINWLVTPDALKMWIAALGFMSVSPKVNYYPDDPVLSAAQDTLKYTVFWPYTEWIFKFWDIESSGIQTFVLGQTPVDQAVKDLTQKVNDMLAQQAKQ